MDIPGWVNPKLLPGYLITTNGISANFPVSDNEKLIKIYYFRYTGKENPILEGNNFKVTESDFS